MRPITEVHCRHHSPKRHFDRASRVRKEVGYASESLVGFGIKDVKDRADQERVARLLPMVPALERSLRIDENIGNVLNVPHLTVAAPNLQQRIVGRTQWISRVE